MSDGICSIDLGVDCPEEGIELARETGVYSLSIALSGIYAINSSVLGKSLLALRLAW